MLQWFRTAFSISLVSILASAAGCTHMERSNSNASFAERRSTAGFHSQLQCCFFLVNFRRAFPKIGVGPQNGWFIMENPMNKWMIWGENPRFLVQHADIYGRLTPLSPEIREIQKRLLIGSLASDGSQLDLRTRIFRRHIWMCWKVKIW